MENPTVVLFIQFVWQSKYLHLAVHRRFSTRWRFSNRNRRLILCAVNREPISAFLIVQMLKFFVKVLPFRHLYFLAFPM